MTMTLLVLFLVVLRTHAWNIFKYQIVCKRFLQNERHDKWALPAVSQRSIQAHFLPIIRWVFNQEAENKNGPKNDDNQAALTLHSS